MAIIIDQTQRLFTLHTRNSTYQMKADPWDTLSQECSYFGTGNCRITALQVQKMRAVPIKSEPPVQRVVLRSPY